MTRITPLAIYALGGVHTHTHTHPSILADQCPAQNQFQETGHTCGRHTPDINQRKLDSDHV